MIKTKKKQIFISIAVTGLLVFFHYLRILEPVENILVAASRPFTGGLYGISAKIRGVCSRQFDKRNLEEIIDQLQNQNQELIQANANLKKQEEENEKLRQYLKFGEGSGYQQVLANVIYKNSDLNEEQGQKEIVIDKGEKQGVKAGMAVVNERGVVVGKVFKVDAYFSQVVLATAKECKLAVSVQNQDKTVGITEGELGLTIKMNFIPQTEVMNIGDNIITSGLEENIPRGLVIGRVSGLEKDSNQIWQTATIEPLVDYDNLVIAAVIIPQDL